MSNQLVYSASLQMGFVGVYNCLTFFVPLCKRVPISACAHFPCSCWRVCVTGVQFQRMTLSLAFPHMYNSEPTRQMPETQVLCTIPTNDSQTAID